MNIIESLGRERELQYTTAERHVKENDIGLQHQKHAASDEDTDLLSTSQRKNERKAFERK